MRLTSVTFLLLGLAGSASTANAAISLNYDSTFAYVTGASQVVDNSGTGVFVHANSGLYDATATSVFSIADNFATFSVTFAGTRLGALDDYAIPGATIRFTTDVDLNYVIAGHASATSGSYNELNLSLIDQFPPYPTVSGNSVLVVDAALETTASNNLTGVLLGGHTYSWDASLLLYANHADDGASGEGFATLSLSPAGAVPEPVSAVVWSLLGLTLGCGCWWRRRKLAS